LRPRRAYGHGRLDSDRKFWQRFAELEEPVPERNARRRNR
jgi:hypothetical protein